MEGNFSDRVRDVISYSREEAIRLGNDRIATEHLLLGVIREGTGGAVKLLRNLGVDLLGLKRELEERARSSGGELIVDNVPLTKDSEKVLKITYLESKLYKRDVIGTEHILLSITRADDCVAAQVLQKGFSVTYDDVRAALDRMVKEEGGYEAIEESIAPGGWRVPSERSLPQDLAATKPVSVDVWVDPGNASAEEIAEFYNALSDLHRAFGGVGVVFRDDVAKICVFDGAET